MLDIIDNLRILIFGSLENWQNYEVLTVNVDGNTSPNWITYIIKYSPELITIIIYCAISLAILYTVYRVIRYLTK